MHAHRDYVEGCFTCKLGTLSFGVVPGAYRDTNSTTMFDREAVKDQFGDTFSKDRVEDMRSQFRRKQKEFLDA
jgi:hypothetical protein